MIKVKFLNENAKLPFKAHRGDAGFDLFASEAVIIPPMSRALIGTGISVSFPVSTIDKHSYYMRIAPRSGLAAKSGIDVFAGVIDFDYRGEYKVCLFNSTNEPFEVSIGDRIAQMIPTVFLETELEQVDDLDDGTSRGAGSFGSSGKN